MDAAEHEDTRRKTARDMTYITHARTHAPAVIEPGEPGLLEHAGYDLQVAVAHRVTRLLRHVGTVDVPLRLEQWLDDVFAATAKQQHTFTLLGLTIYAQRDVYFVCSYYM